MWGRGASEPWAVGCNDFDVKKVQTKIETKMGRFPPPQIETFSSPQLFLLHLPREPLVRIDGNLDGERKPSYPVLIFGF